LSNGELLAAAESRFDVLVTTDRNLRHQQSQRNRPRVDFLRGELGIRKTCLRTFEPANARRDAARRAGVTDQG
jgi:hypothetical protein